MRRNYKNSAIEARYNGEVIEVIPVNNWAEASNAIKYLINRYNDTPGTVIARTGKKAIFACITDDETRARMTR